MDLYKCLYKERSQMFSHLHNKVNRQTQESHRNQQRQNRFQCARNVSISPKPLKTKVTVQTCRENKENAVNVEKQDNPDAARVVKLVTNTTNPQKMSGQEEFVKRYIEWKQNKKEIKRKEAINKKRPFISAVKCSKETTSCSIVPPGHHEEFRPPAGLKNPLGKVNVFGNVKGRQSIYTVVPTPPRKTEPTDKNKIQIAREAFSTNVLKRNLFTNQFENKKPTAPATLKNVSKKDKNPTTSTKKIIKDQPSTSKGVTAKPEAKPKSTLKNLVTTLETPATSTKKLIKDQPSSSKSLVLKSEAKPKSKLKNLITTLETPATSTKKLINDQPSTSLTPKPEGKPKSTLKNLVTTLERPKSTVAKPIEKRKLNMPPKALNMPPPTLPPSRPIVKKLQINKKMEEQPTTKRDGAAGKVKTLASKLMTNTKPARKSPLKSGGARLAQSLKAKKQVKDPKQLKNITSLQLNGKKLLNVATNCEPAAGMIIQTPKDFTQLNPFEEFVTSTKLRTSSQVTEDLEGKKSPTETSAKRSHGNFSAKRILLDDINPILDVQESDKQKEPNSKELKVLEKVSNKFNFIRYSEVNVSYDCDNHNDENVNEVVKENENNATLLEGGKTVIQTSPLKDEITPTKSDTEERAANYLSPFVSVTRGKVSLKKETEKRNSVYLQNTLENDDTVKEYPVTESPKYPVQVRRTLEAVRYFRKQLQDEIARLTQLCDVWESYKNENFEKIQNANGEDMINVAIGQTRLLTSKKFMQFKGLIDRCESGATGINAVPYDGGEATKSITAGDLEGFWSMLGIQVDNLDKRFDNLNRWKSNNWQDPDEVQMKIKKNLTKVTKAKAATITAKAKPNSALQQMLRNMRKIYKNDNRNTDMILTPSKLKHARLSTSNNTVRKSLDTTNSPGRLSIIVKDRKYFSPAATVLSISSPNRKSLILRRKSSQDSPDSPRMQKVSNFSEDLRKTVLRGGCDENHPKTPQSPSSPLVNGRKSILKTPGTAKTRLRNVIFNEKLRVKKFNFFLPDDDSLNLDAESETNNTHEEDLAKSVEDVTQTEDAPRTLSLRNRKVRLRPSCEIVIPIRK